MKQICQKCSKELESNIQFCPNCGTKCEAKKEWKCVSCQETNPLDANFCKQCGNSASRQEVAATASSSSVTDSVIPSVEKSSIIRKGLTYLQTNVYAKYILGLLLLIIVSGLSSYYYFYHISESHYLTKYAEASRKIESANEILTSNSTPDFLKIDKVSSIQQQLQQQKAEIDNFQKDFATDKPLEKYTDSHKKLLNLLQIESSILQEATLILTKPLNDETDNLLSTLKNNVEEAKSLSSQIQVPNITITLSSDMSVLPHHLTLFVEDQRRINKGKIERLAAMNEFFKKMDAMIQRYDGAKTDLGGLLENLRKGGYTWFDYFKALREARSFRLDLRNQIDYLNAPNGTEELKRQFSQVLTTSLQYCDKMNIGAQIEFESSLHVAQPKYNEAKNINNTVQTTYSDFINNYQAEKTRLTTIDNL